jgi:hypothetical protein
MGARKALASDIAATFKGKADAKIEGSQKISTIL